MSHHICYQHLAIRFPKESLLEAIPDYWAFDEDHYLLLELGGSNNMTTPHPKNGGSNNMTTPHPKNGREVGARRWCADAFGRHRDVMKAVVAQAAACEGGGLRLSGERQTLPEGYIRRVRNIMRHPADFADLGLLGVGLAAEIPVPDKGDGDWRDGDREILHRHARLVPRQAGDFRRDFWHLDVGREAMGAALLMKYGHMARGHAWNLVSVDAPCFECDGGQSLFQWFANRRTLI